MPEAFKLSLGYIAGLNLSRTEDPPTSKSSLYALDLAHDASYAKSLYSSDAPPSAKIYYGTEVRTPEIHYKISSNALKRVILQRKSQNDDLCAICLETMKGTPTLWTPCGHCFHTECMNQLATVRNTQRKCPMCRKDLRKDFWLLRQ